MKPSLKQCCSWSSVALLSLACGSGIAQARSDAQHAGMNMVEMKFGPVPGLPACTAGSVQNGDPSKGPSVILAKAAKGCVIPWHWHSPSEHLMMISGKARAEMKDAKPLTMHAGAYALMPSKHVHQFTCLQTCTFYVYSDAAFDIHYVDGQGKEIASDDALKMTKKAPAK